MPLPNSKKKITKGPWGQPVKVTYRGGPPPPPGPLAVPQSTLTAKEIQPPKPETFTRVEIHSGYFLDVNLWWEILRCTHPVYILLLGSTCKGLYQVSMDESLWSPWLKTLRPQGWTNPYETLCCLERKNWKLVPTGKCRKQYWTTIRAFQCYDSSNFPAMCSLCSTKWIPDDVRQWKAVWSSGHFWPLLLRCHDLAESHTTGEWVWCRHLYDVVRCEGFSRDVIQHWKKGYAVCTFCCREAWLVTAREQQPSTTG